MFFHVFAQTTHVVAVPHGFACVVIPATRLYIPSFIEIRSGVSEPRGVKIWPFPLLWLVAFTTACTTVQAVMARCEITTSQTRTLPIPFVAPFPPGLDYCPGRFFFGFRCYFLNNIIYTPLCTIQQIYYIHNVVQMQLISYIHNTFY